MIRKFGRIHSLDTRDRDFLIAEREVLEGVKNWREGDYSGDQGETPMCVGYATAHWLSGFPVKQYLNPAGIYKLAQFLDGIKGEDYEGTTVRGAAKVLASLGLIKEYRWGFTLNALISTVLNDCPVIVGTNFYTGMMEPSTSGLIKATGVVEGGHAYLISGVSTKTQRFRMKNSWGTSWGKDGHAWIKFSDMERLISEDGEICLAIEQPAQDSL